MSQFKKLEKTMNLEVLRDLLSELFTLVMDVYSELFFKVNHQECEALAAVLMSEYKILYHGIFQVASNFFLKCLPALNHLIVQQDFLAFHPGSCTAKVVVWKEGVKVPSEDCILICGYFGEDLEIPANVKGVVVGFVENLYVHSLVDAKRRGVPVVFGSLGQVVSEDVHTLVVCEDCFSLKKVI
jgi:hypothetical protein